MFEKIKYYLIVGFLAIITFLLFKNFTAIQDLTQKNIVEEIKQKDNSEQQNSSQIDVEKQESRTNNSNFDSQNSQNQSKSYKTTHLFSYL